MPHCGGLKNLSGTVGATTLSVGQMPGHNHAIYFLNSTGGGGGWGVGEVNNKHGQTPTTSTGGSQSHTHSLSGISSEEANSLPPYYAGQYVIRV